jgi:hypothetical protein
MEAFGIIVPFSALPEPSALPPPHKGEGGVNVSESPSPLWGGVRGGGSLFQPGALQ